MKYRDAVLAAGRIYLTKVLEETRGDVQAASKIAGVHRTTMYLLMAKCGVQIDRKALPKWIEPLAKYPIKD